MAIPSEALDMKLADIVDPTTTTGLISSILSGAILLGLFYGWRIVRTKLDKVLGQTENSHSRSKYPNMRDEITAIRRTSEETAALIVELREDQRQEREAVRREAEGIREDVRAVGARLDTHIESSGRWRRLRQSP